MSDCYDIPTNINLFPTELLIHIFKYLSAKSLINCRQVCQRWKAVAEEISHDDKLWKKYCEKNYKTIYIDAKAKSPTCLRWFDLYRSLTLWGSLANAKETHDEFSHSSEYNDEIQDIVVMKNGVIAVHKRVSVVYYDIMTLKKTKRHPLYPRNYTKIHEFDDALIIHGNQLHLRIMRRPKTEPGVYESQLSEGADGLLPDVEESIYYNAKFFLVAGRNIYFVNLNNEVFHCNIDKSLSSNDQSLRRSQNDSIITMSFWNDQLNIITSEKNVYTYQNNEFVHQFNLESRKKNVLDALYQFGFLENMEWRLYYIWMATFRIQLPDGPLKYICTLKIHGDVFFIGCQNSVVLIYYKPYVDGQLDFFSHNPVKQYNFSERIDIPVLSREPVLAVEVVEIVGGHKIFLMTRMKVMVITYEHSFEVVKSKAVMSYVPPGPVVLKV